MKKIATAAALLAFGISQAQVTDTCEVWFNDTVAYIDAKTSAYSGIAISQVNDGGSYGYAGYAQLFEAPDTVTVYGMCFYGVMDSGGSFSAAVKMYDNDGVGNSPGTMIAGVSHVIPYFGSGYSGAMDDPSIMQCAMFSNPVVWEGDYYLGIENFTSSDMYIARNATGDGATEDLLYFYYKGVSDPSFDGWYHAYNDYGAIWDLDVIIRPIVGYKSTSVLTYDTTTCLGDTLHVSYENMLDDSLLYNKFYNPNYSSYTGHSTAHTFDYGDMTPVTSDTFHVYTGGGFKGITHSTQTSFAGWSSTSQTSDCLVTVEVVDPYYDIADISGCAGDTAYLVADVGYDSYLWNDLSMNDSLLIDTQGMSSGDYTYYVDYVLDGCPSSDTAVLSIGDLLVDLGEDTTLCLNESLLVTPGSYDSYSWNTGQNSDTIQVGPFVGDGSEEIVVEVMQGNCSGSDTLMITIDNCLRVENTEQIGLEVYPNPSNGVVSFKCDHKVLSLEIYNLIGDKVLVNSAPNGNLINCEKLVDGVYFIRVQTEVGIGSKKIQIIH